MTRRRQAWLARWQPGSPLVQALAADCHLDSEDPMTSACLRMSSVAAGALSGG